MTTRDPICDRHGDASCPCRVAASARVERWDGTSVALAFTVESMDGAPAEGERVDASGALGPRRRVG